MLVNGRRRQQCRDGDIAGIDLAIRNDQNVMTRTHGVNCLRAQGSKTRLNALLAPGAGVTNIQLIRSEFAARVIADVAQPRDVLVVKDGLRHFETHRRVDVVGVQEIRLGSNEGHQRHHHRFANRINRRIGHLREQLLEVVIQRLVLVGHDRQWRVITHRASGFFCRDSHGRHQEFQIFLRVAKNLLAIQQTGFGFACFGLNF